MLRPFARTAIVLSATLGLSLRPARADDPLPRAETVLDQYVEAIGGKSAIEKVKNRVSKGTFEIVGAGLKGKVVATQAMPDKMKTEVDFGDQGKYTEGTDGTVVWEVNPITGDRVVEGDEKADKLLHSTLNGEVRWRELYAKAECTGVEDVGGKPAYKVVLTPKVGKPSTEYYDKASHLQVKAVTTTKGPMGEVEVESYPADYKKVDGILLAHKVKQKLLVQEILISIDEVKQNVDLPADTFKVPDAIKAMLGKK